MKISICGCGWLGFPLAKQMVHYGHEVYGSNRDPLKAPLLAAAGIQGISLTLPIDLDEVDSAQAALLQADLLVVNVPPGRSDGADQTYIAKIKSLSRAAKHYGCQKVVFISTTSVYGRVSGVVTEETRPLPDTASGLAHWQLEQWLMEEWGNNVTILRLAGLIGPGRHPVRYLAGRSELVNGADPVNLVHLDDCILAISRIVAKWPSQRTLHLAAPSHPSRKEYYTEMALRAKLPLPEFAGSAERAGKAVDASRTCEVLAMTMKHPELMKLDPELAG